MEAAAEQTPFSLTQLCYAKTADGVLSKQPSWLSANVCCRPSNSSITFPSAASGLLLCNTRPRMDGAIWHNKGCGGQNEFCSSSWKAWCLGLYRKPLIGSEFGPFACLLCKVAQPLAVAQLENHIEGESHWGSCLSISTLNCKKKSIKRCWSLSKICFLILKENNDVLLMHFWCTFESCFSEFCWFFFKILLKCSKTWCTFDALLKLHQKCIKTLWN